MNDMQINRREFLQSQAGLVVGFSGGLTALMAGDAAAQAAVPVVVGPHPSTLDTWLRIGKDGLVTVNFGKMDCGQGLDVAIAQFVADELDVAYDKVHIIMGDTRFTPNQGAAAEALVCAWVPGPFATLLPKPAGC
ncbi:MAG: hypothetical protein EBQ69_04890 [Betaproteobacteria bacterium]|nr:hypothetical protein [Betaproteobacteria bacterium]